MRLVARLDFFQNREELRKVISGKREKVLGLTEIVFNVVILSSKGVIQGARNTANNRLIGFGLILLNQ
jgi:hypothetical protein